MISSRIVDTIFKLEFDSKYLMIELNYLKDISFDFMNIQMRLMHVKKYKGQRSFFVSLSFYLYIAVDLFSLNDANIITI